jgi:UDP-N-acetyl-D-mannosaminuronic acid transferase (WecB/TagA/CpsF family)
MERFSLATGENWADAVGGGLFAARMNSVMVITPSTWFHAEAQQLIDAYAFRPKTSTRSATGVLKAYILGGPAAVTAEVENALAAQLAELNLEASSSP